MALSRFEEARNVFEGLNDHRSRAAVLVDVGRIKVTQGNVEDALDLLRQALRLLEPSGEIRARAVIQRGYRSFTSRKRRY